MKLAELQQAGRSPDLPQVLPLAGGALVLQAWLRVLPGQRYVAQALWNGRVVLAKLFVGTKAQRHLERERRGAKLLIEQGMTTPALVAEGAQGGEGGWLLFDYLEGATSLGEAWSHLANEPMLSEAQQAILAEALGAVAALHAKGLWQADLHLDNLLRQGDRLWLIDGGGVQAELPGSALGRERVLENLGLFFAQLPSAIDPFIEELLVHYLLINAEHALPLELLQHEVGRARKRRWRDFHGKLGRDCTLFSVSRDALGLRAVVRSEEATLAPLLSDPDAAIAGGVALKRGGSATVAGVEVAGRRLVVKRYNIKGVGHWLRRFWRPSRAWHSWVEGHRLNFLGIASPRPVAVIERRWFGLRSRSYLVTDYADGQDLLTLLAPYQNGTPPEDVLQALERLFSGFLRERISHGDLKGTNLLWLEGRLMLIDLDAARHHDDDRRFAEAYRRDRARLLRNWPADSALHRLLDARLPTLT